MDESLAIIFRRDKVNQRGEHKLIPELITSGNLIIMDDGRKYFKGIDGTFSFFNNEDSFDDKYVFAFPCNKKKVEELICKTCGSEAVEIGLVDYIYEEFLYTLQQYYFYQKRNKLGTLENFMFKKYVKEVEKYDPEAMITDFINTEFLGDEEDEYTFVADFDENPQPKPQPAPKKEEVNDQPFNVEHLYTKITKSVIGQDEPIRQIVSAISKNQIIKNPRLKSNILIAGPTGVGKTEVFRIISKELGLPITIEDSTAYTIAGYVGKDVDNMLINLLINAKEDLTRAERGILVVDEIDKKAGNDRSEKVATSGVLESLLKIMEGGVIQIEYKRNHIPFNTSNLTFVAMGAFSGLEDTAINHKQVGFGTAEKSSIGKFSTDNFERYGILPEFVGRCNTRVFFKDLDYDAQRQILLRSQCSPLLLNKELFSYYGVDLHFSNEAVDTIAEESIALKTGARGLTTITNYALSDVLFKIQTEPIYKEAFISKDTIHDNSKYELKKR